MLTVQKINFSQVKELQLLSIETFRESFAELNTKENLDAYFKLAFNTSQLLKEINNPLSRFFFVKMEDEICGYFKINIGESQTEIKDNDGLELERIYLLGKFQGKKIGQRILEEIKNIAKDEHKRYIWLGVWEKNTKAIKFYERFGFKKFDTHIYPIGDDPQLDWMMRLEL